MHVMHLCGATSGAPWLLEIVRELAVRGHDVSVVIAGEEGQLAQALRAAGVRYHALPHDPFAGGSALTAGRRIWRLAALLRAERPDVLHSHLYPSNIAGRIAGWLADVPIRLSMNAGPYHLESPVFSEVDLLTAWADTRVIASCEYVRDLYVSRGVPADRVRLIYYGSNEARFDPARVDPVATRRDLGFDADTPLVGMVAYFYPPSPAGPLIPPRLVGRGLKGHDVLLRAVPLVLARVPRARFMLVGDGWGERGRTYMREMEALAASLGIADAVLFTGFRADVPDLLAAVDVALQCSLSENLGGTVEALLMRAPTIVARTGGLIDTVRHGETGLVVPPDDPAALAEAILALIGDRDLARRLGAQGRALMLDRFTAARTGSDVDALYRTCAADVRFAGRAPREAGYRLPRVVARWIWSPVWAVRLARPLLAAVAAGDDASSRSVARFVAARVAQRTRDVIVAAATLVVAMPVFAARRLRYRHGPLLVERTMTGRHGLPFPLWTFSVEPAGRLLQRLPWFLTLLSSRQLTLFGPPPVPYDATAPLARSDPRAQRRPGVIALRRGGE